MNKKIFLDAMGNNNYDNILDDNKIKEIIKKSIDNNNEDNDERGHRNLIIVMEELAELSQQIAKQLRDKGDYYAILEELADVYLGIYYVQDIIDIKDSDLYKAVNIKADRLNKEIEKNGYYK